MGVDRASTERRDGRAVKGDRGAVKNVVKRARSLERRRKWSVSQDRERERKNCRKKERKGERERESESWLMVYDIPLMVVVA